MRLANRGNGMTDAGSATAGSAADEADFAEVTTLGDLLLRRAGDMPGRDALILPQERRSYRQLADGAQAWAKLLIARGVAPGEHVGLLLTNCAAFMEALFGIMLAGGVAVPVNARYRAHELAYLAENADLVAIITVDRVADDFSLLGRLREAFPDLVDGPPAGAPKLREIFVLDGAGGSFTDVPPALRAAACVPAARLDERRRQVKVRDVAMILYTSGTTSHPKGCLLTHEAFHRQGEAMARRYEFTPDERVWCPLPMFHIAGISPMIAAFTAGGAFLSLHRIEAGEALRQHVRERVTVSYVLFASLLTDMLYHPGCAAADFSAVRLMVSSPALQSRKLCAELAARWPHIVQIGTFGMTEVIGAACTHSPREPEAERMTRLGRALPGVEARVVGADGRPVATGQSGEIQLRGATLLLGYHKDADKTARSLEGGWFHTGDLGSLDAQGSVLFTGRSKDMLKIGGENASAQEIEIFIAQHPAVKLCCVVGVPDARLDEVAAAFIELKPGLTADADEIIAFCRGRIASFKTPRHVRFVEDWPMSASKVQKFRLREMITGSAVDQG